MATTRIAADMKGLDLLNLETAIHALEAQGAEELHFDIADGRFISRFGFAPEAITAAKQITGLPCHAHLLVAEPARHLPELVRCGADTVTLHVETCIHLHRALTLIREAGVKAGLAVLPATPLTRVNYVFPLIDRLLLLGADPIAPGAAMPRATFERLRLLGENIRYHEYAVSLEVEGPLAPPDAARCARFGAARLVVSGGDAPGLGDAVRAGALQDYREQMAAAVHTV